MNGDQREQRDPSVSLEEALAAQEQLRDKLLPVVVGLHRSNKLTCEHVFHVPSICMSSMCPPYAVAEHLITVADHLITVVAEHLITAVAEHLIT